MEEATEFKHLGTSVQAWEHGKGSEEQAGNRFTKVSYLWKKYELEGKEGV